MPSDASNVPKCWCGREMQPKKDQPTVFATLYRCPDEPIHFSVYAAGRWHFQRCLNETGMYVWPKQVYQGA